jgi:multidrug transporter EmrE-like cation transporter
MTSGKILLEAGYTEQRIAFYFVVYATAFFASLPFGVRNRKQISRADLRNGLIVGVFNATSNLGLVSALTTIPGSIAFPIFSSLGLLIAVILSVFALHEKINKFNAIGIATALTALVLITS